MRVGPRLVQGNLASMPAISNQNQKSLRAAIAQVLAQLTIGLGVCTGAAILAGSTFGQSCDRCTGVNAPGCGCEAPSAKTGGLKPCSCACTPKPSLGEKILSHLERAGDRFEAKAAKPSNGRCDQDPSCRTSAGPTCGCESPQGPSCGCESCSAPPSFARSPFQQSRLPAILRPSNGDSSRFATGSIDDNRLKSTPSTQASPTKGAQTKPAPQNPWVTTPATQIPLEPLVQRVPFEQKRLAPDANRIPADEAKPSVQSIPNAVKSVPLDPPPAWNANTGLPPAASPTPPAAKTPDVLVDPFKDDVSFRGTRDKMEGILLTSDRQITENALRSTPGDLESPARLTPAQRDIPKKNEASGLLFEAAGSDSVQGSQVVPSNYLESVPVKTDLRKGTPKKTADQMPQVSKMRVPTKR